MNRILIFLFLLPFCLNGNGQTKSFGTWIELEFRKDINDKLNFSMSPEVRFQDQFNLDEYLLQGMLSYEPWSFLKIAGGYRVSTEVRERRNENLSRTVFDVHLSREVNRFELTFRNRYARYQNKTKKSFESVYRPRFKVEYDIKGNKINPYISCEYFYNITDKEPEKFRYDVGFDRNLKGPHRIGAFLRFHDFTDEKASVSILGIEYRLKF